MKKLDPEPTKPAAKKRLIPTQKTFTFPTFTPSFIIDWRINSWMKSLVLDSGIVPMLGKVSEGLITIHYTYLFTTSIEIDDTTNV